MKRRGFIKAVGLGAGPLAFSACTGGGPVGTGDATRASEGADASAPAAKPSPRPLPAAKPGSKMKLGLVTYLWGKDWDLDTLIRNCERSKVLGVELRTTHKHGVEPSLSAAERVDVKRRFADSAINFVSIGSNECFDNPDGAKLGRAMEAVKAFVKLSHDVGGSGVKVKPNGFHKKVPREKTIEQIGKSLNALGRFAADYGQEIRLEVHGQCSPLPVIRQIMDVADHERVAVCWNSNPEDLKGDSKDPKAVWMITRAPCSIVINSCRTWMPLMSGSRRSTMATDALTV